MKFYSLSIAAAAALLVTSFAPAQATSFGRIDTTPFKAAAKSTLVEKAQYSRDYRRYAPAPHYAYLNGYPGSREKRPGYRQHANGIWFPAAAFHSGFTGMFSGYAAPTFVGAHQDWCSDRFRSYRAYDNSYQPNKGPRRECISPFIRW